MWGSYRETYKGWGAARDALAIVVVVVVGMMLKMTRHNKTAAMISLECTLRRLQRVSNLLF